ncbi:MAG: hypothetical protein HYZ17_11465 [Betaproteobacteria bacterium]|nr:hypothetical protein [Betaproteobacteria bacterium]
MTTDTRRKGVIIKLFGAILVMVGLLDSVLTLRGGVPAYEFLLLVLLGIAVFGVGAVRAGKRSDDPQAEPQGADL